MPRLLSRLRSPRSSFRSSSLSRSAFRSPSRCSFASFDATLRTDQEERILEVTTGTMTTPADLLGRITTCRMRLTPRWIRRDQSLRAIFRAVSRYKDASPLTTGRDRVSWISMMGGKSLFRVFRLIDDTINASSRCSFDSFLPIIGMSRKLLTGQASTNLKHDQWDIVI